MGNTQNGVNIDKAFPNLMEYQRKEILKNCKPFPPTDFSK